jgi:hypothetical protein
MEAARRIFSIEFHQVSTLLSISLAFLLLSSSLVFAFLPESHTSHEDFLISQYKCINVSQLWVTACTMYIVFHVGPITHKLGTY